MKSACVGHAPAIQAVVKDSKRKGKDPFSAGIPSALGTKETAEVEVPQP